MRRYFGLVKKLDSGKISIREFIQAIFRCKTIDEATATAAYRIYIEDGGKRYTFDDFMEVIERVGPNPMKGF